MNDSTEVVVSAHR